MQAHPDDAEALHDLSILYLRAHQHKKALVAASRVTVLLPDLSEGWLHFGNLKALENENAEAIAAFRKATELAPQDELAWYNLGNVLARTGQRLESLSVLEQAQGLAPQNVNILTSLALAYRKQGRLLDAVAAYQKALELDPKNARIRSNLLVTLQYLPSSTDEDLYAAHRSWNFVHVRPDRQFAAPPQTEKRPLKVGYVSGDFRTHPVGFFLSGVLAHHRPSKIISVCFSDTSETDAMTDKLKQSAAQWFETRSLNTNAFL